MQNFAYLCLTRFLLDAAVSARSLTTLDLYTLCADPTRYAAVAWETRESKVSAIASPYRKHFTRNMSRKKKTPSGQMSTEEEGTVLVLAQASYLTLISLRLVTTEQIDWSGIGPNFTFEIEYPTPASKKRKRGDLTEPQASSNPLTDSMEPRLYTVKPGHMWESANRYRKFTSKLTYLCFLEQYVDTSTFPVSNETFEVNDIVLVAKDEEDPDPKEKSSKRASSVAGLIENKWVAQVLEVRAGDEQHVYLRINWLFRPEDLPIGRQPYHGAMEIIPSNDMQIIDAMTVDNSVALHKWNEYDDDDDPPPDQLYWRQTYDTRKGKTGLSVSRTNVALPL